MTTSTSCAAIAAVSFIMPAICIVGSSPLPVATHVRFTVTPPSLNMSSELVSWSISSFAASSFRYSAHMYTLRVSVASPDSVPSALTVVVGVSSPPPPHAVSVISSTAMLSTNAIYRICFIIDFSPVRSNFMCT